MATGKCCTIWRGSDSALRVSAQAQSCTRVGSLSRVMHLPASPRAIAVPGATAPAPVVIAARPRIPYQYCYLLRMLS